MRIPNSINVNTLKTYEVHPSNVSRNNNSLESFNLEGWDRQLPNSLQEICVETIAKNWTENPILDEIVLPIDRYLLLDLLDTNLPLSLTAPKIEDDVYWKKCYVERWPKRLPHNVVPVEVSEIFRGNDVRKLSSVYSSNSGSKSVIDNLCEKNSIGSRNSRSNSKVSNGSRMRIEIVPGQRTWKEYYIEMHVKEYMENLKPEKYDAEKLKELSDLCSPYVKVLGIEQLQCSEDSPNRIPLNSILTGFQNLRELSLCFKQTYVGEQFSWNVIKTSLQDIRLLAKGLEKLRLQVLRVQNSDIDCEKLITLLRPLLKHETEVLDFSHCKIADRGATAMSKFALEVPVEEIVLINNKIGPKGIECLSHVLCQERCQITNLNLSLNRIADDGGNLLLKSLTIGAKTLKSLILNGCGFSGNISIERMLKTNNSLEALDISNNNVGENVGQKILKAMQHNSTIKKLDLRMCKISAETEFKIYESVDDNRKNRKVVGHVEEAHTETGGDNIVENEEIIAKLENVFENI